MRQPVTKIFSALMSGCLFVVGVAIGCFVLSNLSSFLLHENFLQRLTGTEAIFTVYPEQKKLTPEELQSLKFLVKNGRILTQDQLLAVLAGFYNNIINTLIVVISFLGVLAYLSIRSISRSHAEEIAEKCAEKAVSQKLLDDEFVGKMLQKNEQLGEIIDEYGERNEAQNNLFQKIETKLEKLEERLQASEYWLMQRNGTNSINSSGSSIDGNQTKK